jgi:hypothetical protein
MSTLSVISGLNLQQVSVRPIEKCEEDRFRQLMQAHHYLGALPKIGETLWYKATVQDEWVALLSFSSAAWKCGVRDQWIGWDFRHQYDRLHLVTNNSRFLILPGWHRPNLGSRILALCKRRLATDWPARFGHPVLLLETFVDPERFAGTIYKAANWSFLGYTKGYRRTRPGYSNIAQSRKMVFVQTLRPDAQYLLSRPVLDKLYGNGGKKLMLPANQMRCSPDFFAHITDPRRPQGRRHRLSTILGIAAGATLCGMRGYKAIYDWAKSLGPKAREHFGCRYENGRRVVPSEYVIRDLLVRIDPAELGETIRQWNEVYGDQDETLAIDGKTMRNAIDEQGRQTHIMSVVGHRSKNCYAQKSRRIACRRR